MSPIHFLSLSLLALGLSGQPMIAPAAASATHEVLVAHVPGDDEQFVPWISNGRLSWEDFQCAPLRGTDAVASTSTSLGISYQVVNGKLSYHISCDFSKTKSWGLMKTEYILAHEQGHFDITEVFARKLNEALSNYQLNRHTFRKDINDLYQSIVAEKEEYQQRYDGETDHSRNHRIQSEWLDRIQQMLSETAPYAIYP